MAEIVGAFLGTELWDKRWDFSIEGWNSSRGHFAHECFEFAVRHLDWIEVWRVLRQVANCRPRLLNRLSNTGNQVNPAVIHDDDVVASAPKASPSASSPDRPSLHLRERNSSMKNRNSLRVVLCR